MTLNELIYNIRELLRNFSDDSSITNDHIKYLINNARAKYVKQYLNDFKRKIPSALKQEITLNLEAQSSQGFSDKKYLISIETIPNLLSTQSHYNRTTISSDNDVVRTFTMTSYKRLPYIGSRRGMDSMVYGAIGSPQKLYLVSGDNRVLFLEKVALQGIFEDPEAAWELSDDYSPTKDFDDEEYPLEPSMVDLVSQDVLKLLMLRYQVLEDKINNADEDS